MTTYLDKVMTYFRARQQAWQVPIAKPIEGNDIYAPFDYEGDVAKEAFGMSLPDNPLWTAERPVVHDEQLWRLLNGIAANLWARAYNKRFDGRLQNGEVGLLLHGQPLSGKTYTAQALAWHLAHFLRVKSISFEQTVPIHKYDATATANNDWLQQQTNVIVLDDVFIASWEHGLIFRRLFNWVRSERCLLIAVLSDSIKDLEEKTEGWMGRGYYQRLTEAMLTIEMGGNK